MRALVVGKVIMTLKEVADNVERGGDGEVIVIGKGDRDDERGEE